MDENRSRGTIVLAVVLIGLGVIFLLAQIFNFSVMGYMWPLIIIAVGAMFFVGMVSGGKSTSGLAIPGSIITMIGLILMYQNITHLWATWSYAWALIIVAVGIGLVIHGAWSQNEEARRSGLHVISVGVVLFVIFGAFFELGAIMVGLHSPSGLLWPILLVLVGIYLVLVRSGILPSHRTYTSTINVGEATSSAISTTDLSGNVSGDYTRVVYKGFGDLHITQGDHNEFKMEAPEELKRRYRAEVSGDTLTIRVDTDWWNWFTIPFSYQGPLRLYLTMKDIKGINISGAGNIHTGPINGDTLELIQGGAGNIQIESLTANKLTVNHHGVGNIDVAGKVTENEIALNGAGNFNGSDLECQNARVIAKGLGNCKIWVKESLNVELSGAGNVEYFGNPTVNQRISGLGNIRTLGNR